MRNSPFLLRLARRVTRSAAAGVAAFIGLSASACSTVDSHPASPGQNGAASSGAGPITSASPN